MIPLSDPDFRSRTAPWATVSLITASVLVFLYQLTLDDIDSFIFVHQFGAIPAEILEGAHLTIVRGLVSGIPYEIDVTSPVPDWATAITSMFVHGGFVHLGGNMLFLWVFGRRIEDELGHGPYVMFYFVAGIAAVLAQSVIDSSDTTPMVGASGALSGVLGAYLILHPFSRIRTLIIFGLITVVSVPAIVFLGIWVLIQLFSGFASIAPGATGADVAYFAHLGGFAVGLVFATGFYVSRVAAGGRVGSWLAAATKSGNPRSPSKEDEVEGLDYWASVACPRCQSNELDYIDPPIARWRCRRCGQLFS